MSHVAKDLPPHPGTRVKTSFIQWVCWNRIVDEKTVIPAHSIKLYDLGGNNTGRLLYGDHTVTLECTSTESEAFHNPETPITLTSEGPVCSADTLSKGHEDSDINLDLEEHNEGLKTSVGNYIKHLLGSDDDLIRFDVAKLKELEQK